MVIIVGWVKKAKVICHVSLRGTKVLACKSKNRDSKNQRPGPGGETGSKKRVAEVPRKGRP